MTDDKPPKNPNTPFTVIESDGPAAKEETAEEAGANDEAHAIRIFQLEDDHRDLGSAIDALESQPHHDRLTVARLKKKKLQLKDDILKLKNSITPDIIA